MNQREQDDLNTRLRARSMNLPRMVRCDHCSMPYYQTSAPHVCAGWTTTKLTKETTMSGAGECRDQYDTWMDDLPTCEPARQAAKENEMGNNTTGYPVIDQIQKSIAPSELCVHSDDGGVTHCGLGRNGHLYANHFFRQGPPESDFDKVFSEMEAPSHPATCNGCGYEGTNATLESHRCTEHEPVARGGEVEEWSVEGGSLVGRRRIRGALNYWVADAASDQIATQIVTEHNQHHSLLAERERLREALKGVAIMLNTELEQYDKEPWAQRVRAALNDQKGE